MPAAMRSDASCRPTIAGHLQRAREDRGVIRAAAGVGGKPLDARPVELRRDRRRQLVGDQDRRAVDLAQQLARPARAVPQVHAQAAGDVGDVVLALAQVRILHRREELVELLVGAMHRPRGVDALGADDLLGAADQHRVVEHQDLRVEQRRQLAAAALRQPRADVLQLLPRLSRARVQRRTSRSTRSGGIGKRITSVRCVRITARPTTTPGETPMPVRRSTIPLQSRLRPGGTARRPRRLRRRRRR